MKGGGGFQAFAGYVKAASDFPAFSSILNASGDGLRRQIWAANLGGKFGRQF